MQIKKGTTPERDHEGGHGAAPFEWTLSALIKAQAGELSRVPEKKKRGYAAKYRAGENLLDGVILVDKKALNGTGQGKQ